MPDAMLQGLACLDSHESLGAILTEAIFGEIMRGECDDGQIRSLLVGLRVRGESIQEIEGAARAMRACAIKVPTTRRPVIDTCGTGGSGIARRNVSTAVAIVVAACGVAVAKHGNRAASSRSGSADVLEALGVDIGAPPETVGRCVDEVGVGFLFARALHPAMARAAGVRKALGTRTLFNLLGPLTNPAGAQRQVMGVYDPARVESLARVLGALGSERAFVVHGFRADAEARADERPGIDDLSTEGPSLVWEFTGNGVARHELHPQDAEIEAAPWAELAGADPEDNARALLRLLDGERGAYRSAVQYSGALALIVAGDEPLDRLPGRAAEIGRALDEGRARAVLDQLRASSRARTRPSEVHGE